MVDIRCPKCGKKTEMHASRRSGRSYFICVDYPKCKGRVPVEEDLSGGWSEENPAPEDAQGVAQEVQGEAPGDEDWSGVWGVPSPAPEPPQVKPRQRKAPPPAKSKAVVPVRKPRKTKKKSYGVIKRPERKGRVSSVKSKVSVAGKEKPALRTQVQKQVEPVSYRPLYKRGVVSAPVMPQEPEKPKPAPYRGQYQKPPRWETVPEEQVQSEPRETFTKPQYRRRPRPAPVLPQEPEKSKPAPYHPQYQKPPRWGEVPETDESLPQGRGGVKSAAYRPQYRRGPKAAPVRYEEPGGPPPPPYRPQYPSAQKRIAYSVKEKPPRPRRRKKSQVA